MGKAVADKNIEICVRELGTCFEINTKKLDFKLEQLRAAIKKLEEKQNIGK